MCQAHLLNNLQCMYTSICGDTVDYIELMWGIYSDIVSYVHMK